MENNQRETAEKVLSELPENASSEEILFAIHERLNLEQSLEIGKLIHESEDVPNGGGFFSVVADAFGCIVPLLMIVGIFVAMPFLFSIGEKFIGRRAPRIVESGTLQSITMDDGTLKPEWMGRPCKVVSSHLIIECEDGSTKMIPNESYQSLVLND